MRRFVPAKSSEGAPYRFFARAARKFVVTWSEHDTANSAAKWSNYVGGRSGYEFSVEHDGFSHFKLECSSSDRDLHAELERAVPTDGTTGSLRDAMREPGTVTVVDASQLIRFKLHGHGGRLYSTHR